MMNEKKISEDLFDQCHQRSHGISVLIVISVRIIATMEYLLQDKTEKIIQAFFRVYNITITWELWFFGERVCKTPKKVLKRHLNRFGDPNTNEAKTAPAMHFYC